MLDTLIAGIINGNSYALIAIGVSLIIGVSNVINFAHGSIFIFGALSSWWVTTTFGWPFWAGIATALVVTAALGFIVNLIAVRPFAGKAPIGSVLATIALMVILDNAAQLIFGPETRAIDTGLPRANLQIGGLRFGLVDVAIVVVSLVSMVGLALLLKHTKIGRGIRATAQDREAAAQMGVPINLTQNVAFVIASALGGLAGVLVSASYGNIGPSQGYLAGMQGFAAATLGGLGSLPGAVVGGIVLGILEAFGVYQWGEPIRPLITFGVLLLVLWIRPAGLFGRLPAISREPLTGTFFARAKAIRLKRWQVLALTLLPWLLLLPGVRGYHQQIGVQIVAFSLMALSLTLVGGAAGQISLGQAGPVAVGAYVAALLTRDHDWNFLAAALVAGVIAALISVVIAAPGWRLSGHYASVATMATGAVIVAVILNLDSVTNGSSGLTGIPLPDVFGWQVRGTGFIYAVGLGMLLVLLWVTSRLQRSHLGRFWNAIRDDEVAARSAGIETPAYKSLAFAIGGFTAGLAGAFLASSYGYIDPSMFTQTLSLQILIVAVVGGMFSPFGAVVGAVVLVGGLELFRVSTEGRLFAYGLILLLAVLLRPQGLWSRNASGRSLRTWLTRRKEAVND